jgi:diguanylate cyclase (GGDEF)-like protein
VKVLIVDDNADAVAIAKARLSKENLELITATGGADGLEAARRERPDLVLLDLDMPDMSGFDVCRAMKSDSRLCMIPVIFLSASTNAMSKVKGLDLGAVDYVTKPFDAFELRARVRAALRTKHLRDLLVQYVRIDPLTELPNRRMFDERLEQEWARVQRRGSLALILADLDGLRGLNDAHGRAAGDQALICLAQTLTAQRRPADVLARYGGDEFAILMPDEGADGATRLAEQARSAAHRITFRYEDHSLTLTASFGVVESRNVPSLDALVRRAEQSLAAAKEAGGNQVHKAPLVSPAPPWERPPTAARLRI